MELARGHKYAPEILQAFNVGEMEARTTIYGDRLIAPRDHWRRSRPQITLTRPATPAGGVCWIETSVPDTNVFAKLYKEVEQLTGPHPPRNLVLAFGLRPDALRATLDSGRLVGMGGSGLGRRLETIVGLVVASALWVPYMGVHHAQALLDSGGAPAEVRALVDGSPEEVLSGRECEIARFCEKLTCLPSMLAPSDLDALRQHGLDDREILTIVVCASFENFLSRVAAGLGVSLEDEDFAPAAFEAFDVAALR